MRQLLPMQGHPRRQGHEVEVQAMRKDRTMSHTITVPMGEETRERLARDLHAYDRACKANDTAGMLTHSERPMNYLRNLLHNEGIVCLRTGSAGTS